MLGRGMGMRGWLSGLGAGGSLVLAVVCALVMVSGLIAFRGWPGGDAGVVDADVTLPAPPARHGAHARPGRPAPAPLAAPAARAGRPASRTSGREARRSRRSGARFRQLAAPPAAAPVAGGQAPRGGEAAAPRPGPGRPSSDGPVRVGVPVRPAIPATPAAPALPSVPELPAVPVPAPVEPVTDVVDGAAAGAVGGVLPGAQGAVGDVGDAVHGILQPRR
jgi:hypothetical protein